MDEKQEVTRSPEETGLRCYDSCASKIILLVKEKNERKTTYPGLETQMRLESLYPLPVPVIDGAL